MKYTNPLILHHFCLDSGFDTATAAFQRSHLFWSLAVSFQQQR